MDYQNVINEIKKAKTIAIISHINPDGDTIGSSLAIYNALKMYGKQPYIFCDDPIVGRISIFNGKENYNAAKLDRYDLSIAVDCADMERMGNSISEYRKGRKKMVIDHHKTNNRYGDINVLEIKAAATAQIVTKILNQMHLLNDEIAMLLYSGLITDSGGFSFSNVTTETMQVASILLNYNFEAHKLCEHFMKKVKFNVYQLKSRVLSAAKFYDNNTIGIITFRQSDFEETGTDLTCTEGIINNIINIIGIKVAVSISEVTDKDYKVSIRTGDDVDSSKIAMVFGGGGHKNASGLRISGFYEDVVDKLLKAVRDEIC